MAVTLKDIARRLNLDPSTVSVALRQGVGRQRGIPERRIRQIERVAAEMGYRPNLSARNLRRGATQCIGVVMSYLDDFPLNHYFTLISDCCRKNGYYAVPLPMERRLDTNVENLKLLETAHVDGLLLLDYHHVAHEQYMTLHAQRHAMVFRVPDPPRDRTLPFPRVEVNQYRALARLFRHLVGAGWHNVYVFTEADPDRPSMLHEEEPFLGNQMSHAIRDVLREFDLPVDFARMKIPCRSRSAKDRYEAVRRFLREHRGEANLCLFQDGGDGISGMYTAIAEAGLKVGDDLAVAAGTVPPLNEFVLPEPSVMIEPYEQIAAALVDMVLTRIPDGGRADGDPQVQVFEPDISISASAPQREPKRAASRAPRSTTAEGAS